MTDPDSILLYVRPWNRAQMEHLAREVWGTDARLTSTSEHQTADSSGLAGVFLTAFRQTTSDANPRFVSETEVADITLRCRLLRELPARLARRLMIAMEQAVDTVLNQTRPAAMLSLTVDSYVMDLFAHLCAQRGIQFIGLVPSFLKGHFRVTVRGEHVYSREVTPEDIDMALSSLVVKDYRPDFLVQSAAGMRRQAWRLWLRNLPKPIWFAMRRTMPGEKLNYHYWASQMVARRYWSPLPRRINGISGEALARLQADSGPPLIYLPLQMSPEATIDYWSADTRWIDYETFIVDLVRRYRDKWRFVVKEHPNLLGYRSRGFYRRLEAEPNCVMVAPKVPSNDLVELCQGVLVCTGTAGFEASLRGKPVLSDSAPYYAPPDALLPLSALDGDLPPSNIDIDRQKVLMAHLLACTLPGRFLNNGSWTEDNPEHRAWGEKMAASIRGFLDRTGTNLNTPMRHRKQSSQ